MSGWSGEDFTATRLGERAVVIGGSMAGLMAARVLADHFESVTILERDHIEGYPALHKSIPQGKHFHALLAGGQRAMASSIRPFSSSWRIWARFLAE